MIGGVDTDAVDLFAQLIEHHAKVFKLGHINCPWFPGKLATINVTERDDIFAFATTVSHIGNATGTNVCDVQFTIRRRTWLTDRKSRKNESTRTGGRCGFNKVSTLHEDLVLGIEKIT
jgi:hypothetical protein